MGGGGGGRPQPYSAAAREREGWVRVAPPPTPYLLPYSVTLAHFVTWIPGQDGKHSQLRKQPLQVGFRSGLVLSMSGSFGSDSFLVSSGLVPAIDLLLPSTYYDLRTETPTARFTMANNVFPRPKIPSNCPGLRQALSLSWVSVACPAYSWPVTYAQLIVMPFLMATHLSFSVSARRGKEYLAAGKQAMTIFSLKVLSPRGSPYGTIQYYY